MSDHALLDEGASGLERFAAFATSQQSLANPEPIEPLYLRRPDVSVPNPLKHVLNHAGAERDGVTVRMIVDHTNIDEEIVVPQMASLEADLFGRERGASSLSVRNSARRHARICSILMIAGLWIALQQMGQLSMNRLRPILPKNSLSCAGMPVSGMTATMLRS